MDVPDVCAGRVVHVRCQRDGAFFCCGDGHAIQGDGEINTCSLEVSLEGVLRIERSEHQDLRTILIESPEETRIVWLGVLVDLLVAAAAILLPWWITRGDR